jgi:hypothetical protein
MYVSVEFSLSEYPVSVDLGARVYVTSEDAEVVSWDVEGVKMPLSALNDTLYDAFLDLALDEWNAYNE